MTFLELLEHEKAPYQGKVTLSFSLHFPVKATYQLILGQYNKNSSMEASFRPQLTKQASES